MKEETNNTTTIYGGYEVVKPDPDTVEVKHPEKKIGYHLIGKEIEVKKFVFTIEMPGLEVLQSPELNVYGKGGKIYFGRFGVVKNEHMDELEVWPAGKATALSPVNAPKLEGFSYCRKPLRDGYLYIYDEYDSADIENVFHEYEVRSGRLQEIEWTADNMGDVRKVKDFEFTNFHIIPPPKLNMYI
ncbi:MAG: hypothetical protein LUE98_16940 [Tannerellaceae bacterium]|nr:hypothetical protein [Tannerellaceae bacterium]